jgi:hypothetical protein
MRGVDYINGRFVSTIFGFFSAIFRPFFRFFSVSLQLYRPSLALFASFISTLRAAVSEGSGPANVVGKGSVLVASEQDLEQLKDALGSRRVWRHTGRLAPGPDFRGMAFQSPQSPFSEVAHIAVVNGKAICSV